MIDNFSLLVSHGLVMLACWRLLKRDDLDQEIDAREEAAAAERAVSQASKSWRKGR